MIEQVTGWVLVIYNYFITLCYKISFYVKRLGSFTSTDSSAVHERSRTDFYQASHDRDKKQTSQKSKLKPSSEIPGPKCLPLFGSLFEFMKFGTRRLHELSVERHEQFGDIFREKVLSQEMVFVANVDLMKQWMTQQAKNPDVVVQEPSHMFAKAYPQFKRGLFYRQGEDWGRLRKVVQSTLVKNASTFETSDLLDACATYMDEQMKTLRHHPDGAITNLETFSYEFTLGVLIRVMFGSTYQKFEEYSGTTFETLCKNAIEINIHNQDLLEVPGGIAKMFNMECWTGFHTKLAHNLTSCLKFSSRLRDDIMESPENASMKTYGLLYKMLMMNIAPQDIDDMLTDFACDTKDPFAGTMMFLTQLLATCPDIQEAIYEEVCQICPKNQMITLAEVKRLEYTEAFFKEAIRLYPIAPFTARIAMHDTVIGGYLIRPGTYIMYSTYVTNRDPRYFADPMKVWPERWLESRKQKVGTEPLKTTQSPVCDTAAFGSFGLGKRVCIGNHLATAIFTMYLANLVRNFKMTSDELPEPTMRTVLYPSKPGLVRLEIR
ncbi:1,25-dihydroxyvitamin D(3) 24-hydroxylase, mitochondrial [Orchesella cincta]|uniref:1,25-dihydroxyvitamin D(3) 24-hydroxylase, mitochondrial n=1 Tax=Orchesella cincta TaxID=48709 RepID=A0A1D2N9C1_ORCCI|nr:1,25-dihydroxyvitamin D(3) 24-hydroxylase, mitochondrial [Orchesella cincta]